MRHKQLLNHLAIGNIPEVVQDEVNRIAGKSFVYAKHAGLKGRNTPRPVPPVLQRWGGLLDPTEKDYDRMIGHQVAPSRSPPACTRWARSTTR